MAVRSGLPTGTWAWLPAESVVIVVNEKSSRSVPQYCWDEMITGMIPPDFAVALQPGTLAGAVVVAQVPGLPPVGADDGAEVGVDPLDVQAATRMASTTNMLGASRRAAPREVRLDTIRSVEGRGSMR